MSTATSRTSRVRAVLANLLLSAGALAVTVLAVEAAFRLAPRALLPAGVYGSGVRHPLLGLNVHGGPVIYK